MTGLTTPMPLPTQTPPLRIERTSQVSAPIPARPHIPRHASHGVAPVPEVVRVQRLLLGEDTSVDIDQLENWSLTHVVHEYIDPATQLKMLRLRYENDEGDDVCEGAVHRPLRIRPPRPKKPHPGEKERTSSAAAVHADLPARSTSLPQTYCSRASSREQSTSGTEEEVGQSSESDVTISDFEVRMPSTKRQRHNAAEKRPEVAVDPGARVQGLSSEQRGSLGGAPDSDSILSEREYARCERPRAKPVVPNMVQPIRGSVGEGRWSGCSRGGRREQRSNYGV
jgi:hypothetical protein